jgi:PadR family transcriptional regulator PadR
MPRSRPDPNFMTGVPELLVLRLLAEREMYGYEIGRAIVEATAARAKAPR